MGSAPPAPTGWIVYQLVKLFLLWLTMGICRYLYLCRGTKCFRYLLSIPKFNLLMVS